MFCENCGAQLHDRAVVCIKCGCPVSAVPYMAPQQPINTPNQPNIPNYSPNHNIVQGNHSAFRIFALIAMIFVAVSMIFLTVLDIVRWLTFKDFMYSHGVFAILEYDRESGANIWHYAVIMVATLLCVGVFGYVARIEHKERGSVLRGYGSIMLSTYFGLLFLINFSKMIMCCISDVPILEFGAYNTICLISMIFGGLMPIFIGGVIMFLVGCGRKILAGISAGAIVLLILLSNIVMCLAIGEVGLFGHIREIVLESGYPPTSYFAISLCDMIALFIMYVGLLCVVYLQYRRPCLDSQK